MLKTTKCNFINKVHNTQLKMQQCSILPFILIFCSHWNKQYILRSMQYASIPLRTQQVRAELLIRTVSKLKEEAPQTAGIQGAASYSNTKTRQSFHQLQTPSIKRVQHHPPNEKMLTLEHFWMNMKWAYKQFSTRLSNPIRHSCGKSQSNSPTCI